jgi:hypothetical protein
MAKHWSPSSGSLALCREMSFRISDDISGVQQWRAPFWDDPTRNRWLVFTLCHCAVTISAVFSFNEPSVSTWLSNVASCLTAFSIWKVILSALCHRRRMHNQDGFYLYFPLLLLPELKWRWSTNRETRWRPSKLDLMTFFQDLTWISAVSATRWLCYHPRSGKYKSYANWIF